MNIIRSLFLITMMLFSLTHFAQEEDFSEFNDTTGVFTFSYPAEWVAEGALDVSYGTLFAMTTNSAADLFEYNPTETPAGSQTVIFFMAGFDDMNEQMTADMTIEELTQLMTVMISTDLSESTPMMISGSTVIELASKRQVGRVDFYGGESEGLAIAYPLDEYVVVGFVMAHMGELVDFESRALQIIDSFSVDMGLLSELTSLPTIDDVLPAERIRRNVIFDGDMAHDDMNALIYLLNHPYANVLAVTVEGTGEAHCEAGVRNTHGVLIVAGQPDVRVACGRETPLVGDHEFPAGWRAAADDFYGLSLPRMSIDGERDASSLIKLVVGASIQPVTIVAVGPLTNIAEAIQNAPQIILQIEAIYVMGGAVNTPGNVGPSNVGIDNAVAEWNIYIDPVAANIVLQSGIPVTLVPLDATQYVPVTTGFIERLGGAKITATANLVYDILMANSELIEFGGFQFWDSVTAAIMTDNSLATFETYTLHVVEDEGPESGFTKLDDNGVAVRVAVMVDQSRFENLLLAVLNQ